MRKALKMPLKRVLNVHLKHLTTNWSLTIKKSYLITLKKVGSVQAAL